jgi:hypothetical protein
VGGTTLRYSVAGRQGASSLDTGRVQEGDGYRYLEAVLAETLSGTTSHAGALLGPLSIRYVVAALGDLPPSVLSRLDGQVDLDLIPAGGLVIYRNERALPPAWASTDPAYARAARGGSLLDVASLPAPSLDPLGRVAGGFAGKLGGGGDAREAVVAQQFASGWRLRVHGEAPARAATSPHRAFGWATGFAVPTGANGVVIEYGRQWIRTVEMSLLGLFWIVALWVTRKPAMTRRGRRRPSSAVSEAREEVRV